MDADDLLRRALLEPEASAAVALRVSNLPVSESVTVVFHGRRDLGTIQTYVAHGRHGTGAALSADALLRVPCDLDLGDAEDRDEAERLYAEQAAAMRDALEAADTVLAVWREPFQDLAHSYVDVDTRVALDVDLPAHRLLPTALIAADRQMVVAPVCEPRTLAEGLPPLGIACLQQDIARVYRLPDDPESCLEDFLEYAAEHAHRMADALERSEASVRRFLELSDFDDTA
jgi:muconolactone delta-isomerase